VRRLPALPLLVALAGLSSGQGADTVLADLTSTNHTTRKEAVGALERDAALRERATPVLVRCARRFMRYPGARAFLIGAADSRPQR